MAVSERSDGSHVQLVELGVNTAAPMLADGVGKKHLCDSVDDSELVRAEVGRKGGAVELGGLAVRLIEDAFSLQAKCGRWQVPHIFASFNSPAASLTGKVILSTPSVVSQRRSTGAQVRAPLEMSLTVASPMGIVPPHVKVTDWLRTKMLSSSAILAVRSVLEDMLLVLRSERDVMSRLESVWRGMEHELEGIRSFD